MKDNEELKYEVSRQTRMNDRFKIEKKQTETELNSLIKYVLNILHFLFFILFLIVNFFP